MWRCSVKHGTSGAGGLASLPPSKINSQILAFNQDFNVRPHGISGFPEPTGTSAHIEFVLAGIDSASNTSWYRNMGAGCSAEDSATTALHWDPTKYFNIYTADPNMIPYSTYPWACGSSTYFDGIRLGWSKVGRPNGSSIGRVPIHEAGHYLGLYHPQQCSNCSGSPTCYTTGDLICDLPQDGGNAVCSALEWCTGNPSAPNNYMSSRADNCVNRFTSEQVARMRCALQTYHSGAYLGIVESSIQETVTQFCSGPTSRIRFVISWDTNVATNGPDWV